MKWVPQARFSETPALGAVSLNLVAAGQRVVLGPDPVRRDTKVATARLKRPVAVGKASRNIACPARKTRGHDPPVDSYPQVEMVVGRVN